MPAQNFHGDLPRRRQDHGQQRDTGESGGAEHCQNGTKFGLGIGDGLRDRGTQAVCPDRLKTG
jgi:hypothetical protein